MMKHLLVVIAGLLFAVTIHLQALTITEALHEGRAQFRIETRAATYYYDRAGGGFARLLDRDGVDWISFKKDPLNGRAAAGAGYRGIPNLVFGQDNPDAGAGHPGHDKCETTLIAADAIRTVSLSGRWAWTWRFTEEHAVLTIEQADPERPYWFLYEGTVGGRWSPRTSYFGTNRGGPRRETPFGRSKLYDSWRWVYFGEQAASRVLLAGQVDIDDASETLWYMGNSTAELDAPDGMVVFGFGRGEHGAALRGAGRRFVLGFVEQAVPDDAAHAIVAAIARRWLREIEAPVRVSETTLQGDGEGFRTETPAATQALRRIGTPPAASDGMSLFAPLAIDVWHGDEQHFGRLGVPQKWVNILGRVSRGDGLASLQYSLNGGAPVPLAVGQDNYRLARDGDFNVDLEFDALRNGVNELQLIATDRAGRRVERTVKVVCERGHIWPLPYSVDWTKVRAIDEAVQVVDGRWRLEGGGVRTVEPYYDRILALGDRTWTDYTVTAEVTFHSYAPPLRGSPTYGVSHAALAARYPGHFADDKQPHVQWYPLGAVAEFRLGLDIAQSSWRFFVGGGPRKFPATSVEPDMRKVELGVPYKLKLRVDTLPGGVAYYRAKSWKSGEPEPTSWEMAVRDEQPLIRSGGALIVAHNTDVTIGRVTATPNEPE